MAHTQRSIWQFDITPKKLFKLDMYEPTSQANFAYMTSVKYATEEEVRLYMTFRKFLIMTLQ